MAEKRLTTCSFCGKSSAARGLMIEGPGDIYMCGDCVDVAANIIHQQRANSSNAPCVICSRPASEVGWLTMVFGGALVCDFCAQKLVEKALAEKQET